jgi:chemotaxis protein CheD
MADMKADCRPIELVTNVGSCIAICMYDSTNKCGGLAHIMLPDSRIAPKECLPSKFADTAVPALGSAIRKMGKYGSQLSAKIAGGANMFAGLKNTSLNVGVQNAEAVKQHLAANEVRLVGEDVGGSRGRRVAFNVVNGSVVVRTLDGGIKRI